MSEEKINEVNHSEMLEHIRFILKYASVRPRTYVCEFSFYTIVSNFKQKFTLGSRPEDLANIDTIEQKALKKHQAHLNRLEQFPLEKAEYYQRLKEAHGVNTVRGLSGITGEDWSYIAKVLKIMTLAQPIKDYLTSHKNDHIVVKFFHLRVLLEIARQGEERLQLACFREFLDECFDNSHEGNFSAIINQNVLIAPIQPGTDIYSEV